MITSPYRKKAHHNLLQEPDLQVSGPRLEDWKEDSGYQIRSLAETTMFRLKTIFGDEWAGHLVETQTTQALICCAALSQMTHLGMSQSYKVS